MGEKAGFSRILREEERRYNLPFGGGKKKRGGNKHAIG